METPRRNAENNPAQPPNSDSLEDQVTPPSPRPIGETPPLGIPVSAIRRQSALPGGGLARSPFRITFGQSSDVGLIRSNNEDSTLSFCATQIAAGSSAHFGLFMVADGAGGHDDGEEASATAVRVMAEHINRHVYLPMLRDENGTPDADSPSLLDSLGEAVRAANRAVIEDVPGAGTTLTVTVLMGHAVYLAHVGDSRAYLIARKAAGSPFMMERLTRDHSVARRLEETGQITAEEAATHPEKNRLWKILGRDSALEPDVTSRPLAADTYLLLCTDGLWGSVPEDDLLPVILTSGTPQEACDRLIAFANARGGEDNSSAILLKVEG